VNLLKCFWTTLTALTEYSTLFGILTLTLCITQYYTAQLHEKVFVVKLSSMFLLPFVLENVAQPYFSRKCLLPAAILVLRVGYQPNFCLAIWIFFQIVGPLYEQFLQVQILGLSHRDPYAMCRLRVCCLELYYCNIDSGWFANYIRFGSVLYVNAPRCHWSIDANNNSNSHGTVTSFSCHYLPISVILNPLLICHNTWKSCLKKFSCPYKALF